MNLLKVITIFAAAALFTMQPAHAEPVHENYLFEIPGLPKIGPAFVSWYFLRNGSYWSHGEVFDLAAVEWPIWEIQQIPTILVPAQKQASVLLIYDANKKVFAEIELKEPFDPENFYASAAVKPAFYQVRIKVHKNHVEMTSPFYVWPQKRRIARCEVDASPEKFDLRKSKQMEMCLDTLRAYLGEHNTDTRQFYVSVEWPTIKGRENVLAAKEIERDLRAATRKKKMIFLSQKIKGNTFHAEVGLTQTELLPKIGFPVNEIGASQSAILSPDTKTVSQKVMDREFAGGAHLNIYAFYSDVQSEPSVESPPFGNYQVSLQFVDKEGAAAGDHAVELKQTRSYERRTGMMGFMRPWQILSFGGYNLLSSSRGENSEFIGLPGFDFRYNSEIWGLQPYFSFEKDLLHLGSSLDITEVKAGLSKRMWFWPQGFYSLGYHEYNLAGKNRGSLRLGSITAVSLGLGASQRFERWAMRETFNLLLGNTQSYDFRLEFGRTFGHSTDDRYFAGTYLGYSSYRGHVINKINASELLTEDRLQVGILLGWVGADSF